MIEHARSLHFGYVVARDTPPDKPLYLDPSVTLHALNKKRLLMTLESTAPLLMEFNADAVNSIFLPTLPANDTWGIRRP